MVIEGYIGRKTVSTAKWFVPKVRKLRFVAGGGRCIRAATIEEVEAWFRVGSPPSPMLLSQLTALAAKQAVPPPVASEASVSEVTGTSFSLEEPDQAPTMKRARGKR